MVKKNDCVENKFIGKKIVFKQTSKDTNGELFQYEMFENFKGIKDLIHYHPYAEEKYTVLKGTLSIVINGVEKDFHIGETAVVPPGTFHTGWSSGKDELHIVGEIRPAMRYEDLYATHFGLVTDGKCNQYGATNLFQTAVTMAYLKDHTYFPGSKAVQKTILKILAFIGRILGYKALYAKYTGKDE